MSVLVPARVERPTESLSCIETAENVGHYPMEQCFTMLQLVSD